MLDRWTMLTLPALLAAALGAAAADSDTLKAQTDSQKLDKVLDQLKEFKAAAEDLQKLRESLKALEGDSRVIQERIDRVNDRIGALEARIKRVESDLEALRPQTATSNRQSGYAGVGNGTGTPAAPPPLPPAAGTIRLRNTFPEPVSIILDGVSYEVMPNETRDLAGHPAGVFTYEVLGGPGGLIQGRRTVDLHPSETFTITVFPR
jgi:hypothetical protein